MSSSSREKSSNQGKRAVSTDKFMEQVDSWIEDLHREGDQIFSLRMQTAMMEDRLAMVMDTPQQGDLTIDKTDEDNSECEEDDPFAIELMASTSSSSDKNPEQDDGKNSATNTQQDKEDQQHKEEEHEPNKPMITKPNVQDRSESE